MKPMPEILLDTLWRFWSKVNQRSDSECWRWTGAIVSNGYGQIRIKNKNYQAHRISYYIHHKEDPGELLVCHECNNKLCVNPEHLFLGTHQENIQHAFDTNIICQRGILNGCSQLLESNVREIKQLQNIISQRKIAKLFCVSHGTISAIFSGRSWTHVH